MVGTVKESSKRKKRVVERKWNLTDIYAKLGTPKMCITFAEENNLLPKTMMCPRHKTSMFLKQPDSSRVGMFYCIKDSCRSKTLISRAKGTVFGNAELCLPHIFYLMYCFTQRYDEELVKREDFIKFGTTLTLESIRYWNVHYRRVIAKYQLYHQEYRGKIGGLERIVRLYKYEFKYKNHFNGIKINGGWLLGILEEGRDDLRLELCCQDKRLSQIIMPLIQKHVLGGSTICVHAAGNYKLKSNNKYIFCNTNTCDVLNPNAAQRRLMMRLFSINLPSTKTMTAEGILECLWRKSMKKKNEEPFNGLIEAVKYVYNGN